MKYTEAYFKQDKKWYRYIYRMLAEGGPDAVQKLFMECDKNQRDYIVFLIEGIAESTRGLHEALLVAGSKYGDHMMKTLKENSKEI